jgi:ABC-type multidrug transport system ATPase subunit
VHHYILECLVHGDNWLQVRNLSTISWELATSCVFAEFGRCGAMDAAEMIVGPMKTLFMDEISTGLDSSTTFSIVKSFGRFAHELSATVLISLLQPAPETFNLFDDVLLLSEGQVVYHGPIGNVMEFFESCGFRCPDRKGIADFLQEVCQIK